MNNKIHPVFIAVAIATGIMFNSFTGNTKKITHTQGSESSKKNTHPACTATGNTDKANTGAAVETISSYPSIIYVDM